MTEGVNQEGVKMEVLKWLHQMLGGSSPQTGYIGSATIFFSVMDLMRETIATEGMPQTKFGWLALGLGVAARLAKDANQTNSQHPAAVSMPAPVASVPVVVPSGLPPGVTQ